jgi:hypothetical protein
MKQSKHGLARVWPAVMMMGAWLAGGAGAWAADAPVALTNNPMATGDVAVLVDDASLWRHFHLVGPCTFLTATGALIKTGLGEQASGGVFQSRAQGGTALMEWPTAFTPPPPSANWANADYDDHTWPRVLWPQPTQPDAPDMTGGEYGETTRNLRGWNPYDTVGMLVRNKFEIKDPAQVKSCRLSLDYWGGVVVYVNGKEVARGHLPDKQAGLMDRVADAYPDPVWVGKNRASPLRQLREVEIPVALLRPGLNVLAVEAHAAPVHHAVIGTESYYSQWAPIGLLNARLSVSPASAATNREPRGVIRLWNSETYDTVTVFDRAEAATPVRPVQIRAARNSTFSGRLMVGSDQPIKGLKVTLGDLVLTKASTGGPAPTPAVSGGIAKIPRSAVRVRCAAPAEAGKSWLPAHRFDGLFDTLPANIPVSQAPPAQDYTVQSPRPSQVPGAVAPLWFTVRVPKDTLAGEYEGKITVAAEGLAPTNVPLRVRVCAWTMPDPREWRIQNFLYHAEEVQAKHYGVTNYSARHLELVGKSLALLAELNSFQVQANLAIDFFVTPWPQNGGHSNPESLVRWIPQADGSYTHDFTVFDRYLAMVAKAIGKPRTLRLNCWGAIGRFSEGHQGRLSVTVLDPATARLSSVKQPPLGTKESLEFWKPVFRGMLERIKARGWLDETTIGFNDWYGGPSAQMVDVAHDLWPEGAWSFTGHNAGEDMVFAGTTTNASMAVRHSDGVYNLPTTSSGLYFTPGKRTPLWGLDAPRRNTSCWTLRMIHNEYSPLREIRRLPELYILMPGYDGVGEIGADLFPLKRPVGGYYAPAAGAGTGWTLGRSTISLLYPGPDGTLATERFEMFREGAELCEAVLFVRNALYKQQIIGELQQRAERYLTPVNGEREIAFNRGWFGSRYRQAEEDAKLLDLAGEVVESSLVDAGGKAYGMKATGGTFTNRTGGFWVHRFMNVGTAQFTPSEDITVECLVVGGGGGGGCIGGYGGGGGGGAGGIVYRSAFPCVAGSNYTLTVGDGGVEGRDGGDGGYSSFGALKAGGGGGGGAYGNAGRSGTSPSGATVGGCGGGAGRDTIGGAGPAGSPAGGGRTAFATAGGGGILNLWGSAGGGGGACEAGHGGGNDQGPSGSSASQGGAGTNFAITGVSRWYAGGGAGAWQGRIIAGGSGGGGSSGRNGVMGFPNTGSGGGGGAAGGAGGKGGSGIVIIRYKAGSGRK